MSALHTPGPWTAEPIYNGEYFVITARIEGEDDFTEIAETPFGASDANARLIAAAPDHAIICRAVVERGGNWVAWSKHKGEFCIGGIRHCTTLDEFGCPKLTPALRAQLALMLETAA